MPRSQSSPQLPDQTPPPVPVPGPSAAAYGPAMPQTLLPRRQLLHLAALGLPLLLSGCREQRRQLMVSRGDFASLWAARLPRDWTLQTREQPTQVLTALQEPAARRPALAQLWDGWASGLPAGALQPFAAPWLLDRLIPQAAAVSRLYAPAGSPVLAFPWAMDPWVLLLRNRDDLARRAEEGWNLLLDPGLRGRLVLPSSPRLTLSLVQGDPQRLRRLRAAALASDERDGLNLLLSGDAEALVVPRRRAVPLLRSDPRLRIVLPPEGAPLGWNLLVRPAGEASAPPRDWLEAALQPPLLPRLLAAGWVPPLPRSQLESAAATLPAAQRALLLPPEPLLQRCWSLPPLDAAERRRLQALWDETAPTGP